MHWVSAFPGDARGTAVIASSCTLFSIAHDPHRDADLLTWRHDRADLNGVRVVPAHPQAGRTLPGICGHTPDLRSISRAGGPGALFIQFRGRKGARRVGR